MAKSSARCDVTLSPIWEDGCDLMVDAISEPSNHADIFPTHMFEEASSGKRASNSVATTLTDQVSTTMLQTSIWCVCLTQKTPPLLLVAYGPAKVPRPLG
eukprot:979302-Ditylum_brightwellii.AAC.1